MPLIINDRVKETTATAGTGTITLGGATAGFQSFQNGIGTGNTTFYTIVDSNNPPTFWEVGLGTYSNISNTLSRDTVYSSSAGGAKVALTGVSFVFSDYPATQAVYESKLVAGANITINKDVANNQLIIASTASGGGGGFSSAAARWTVANATSKNAYSSQPTVNNDGITIVLTASANPGTLAAWTATINGSPLGNTYLATGSFPTYTVNIPVGDLIGNNAQISATVTIVLSNASFNLVANNLTNVQPVAFTTVLSGSYAVASVPFYATSASINYSYTNTNAITSFGGSITPTGGFQQNATSPSGTFSNQPINGASIGGSATGTGLNGAGSSTVNFSGSIPALATFVPAFFAQTSTNATPTFTTASSQTTGAAAGSTITYPTTTATTQYNWVATTLALPRVDLVTPLGVSQLVPDITTTQSISGTTFNVFGWTSLVVGQASQIFITTS